MAKADVGALVQAVDRAAGEASRSSALLLTVCLIFLATVIETTHQDIFLNTSKPLPQIGTRLPLIGIFVVVPLAIAILHLITVLQVRGLILRTCALCRAMAESQEQERPALTLPPSLLVQWIVARDAGVATALLTSLLVAVILVVIPLGTLLAAQVRFLPYHAAEVTWLHRALITLDVVALFTVFALAWQRPVPTAHGGGRPVPLHPSRAWAATTGGLAAFVLAASFLLATVPGESLERRTVALAAGVFRPFGGDPPPCAGPTWRVWNYLRPVVVGQPGLPDEPRQMLCAVRLLAENDAGGIAFLRRNLVLREAQLTVAPPSGDLVASLGEAEAWRAASAAIVVAGRDLRYADLTGVHLRGVDLRGVDLTGARLVHARLDFANLGDAGLLEVGGCPNELMLKAEAEPFCQTWLRGVDLTRARLHGTFLLGAKLTGSIMPNAKWSAASLRKADLRGLSLKGLDLAGADLTDADLSKADLTDADLRAANLRRAKLDEAVLTGAKFDGADLRQAVVVATRDDKVAVLRQLLAPGADLREATVTVAAPGARCTNVVDLLASLKGEPPAGVDLTAVQVSGLILETPEGRDVCAEQADEIALAQALARLACEADNPGVVVGVARRIMGASELPKPHEALTARKLQSTDCAAASNLNDAELCKLIEVERRYVRYRGQLQDGPPAGFALTLAERRQPSRPCVGVG